MGLWQSFGSRRPPSRDRLAREVHRELELQGRANARFDPEAYLLEIRQPAGEPVRLHLETLYQEILRDPGSRRNRVERFVRAALAVPEVPASWDEVRNRLLPVIRPVTTALSLPESRGPLARPAWPYLAELAVIDMPDSIAFVTGNRPAEWGVTADEVFDIARENLRRKMEPTPPPAVQSSTILRLFDDGDAYWVSHLLIDGWLAGFAEHVGGKPVAFIPDRDAVIIASDDPHTLAQLFELVESEYADAPRGISPMAYTSDERGKVVPYPAPVGHPLYGPAGRAKRLLAAVTYGDQAASLDDLQMRELKVVRRADGSYFTVTEWARGVDAFLPAADFVAFVGDGGTGFIVPWPHVIEHADLVRTPGLDPVRYRVMDWPPEEVLTALRGLSVRP